ncbi:MAG: Hpt domain-containing protein [Saprospiraceae bacterium]|nr:Hpt domain-containing protein [Saprospiraceae bacterium]
MPDSPYKYVDLSYLESISGGDAETEKTILQMLLADMEQLCPMLRTHFEAPQMEELEKVAHKLKTSLAFSGNPDIMKSNDEVLEIARTQNEMDRVPTLIARIEELTPLIIQELHQVLAR